MVITTLEILVITALEILVITALDLGDRTTCLS